MDLVVVGSVAYDSIETAYGKRDDLLGGAATYIGITASRLCKPGIVGVVGDDFRSEDVALLERHGVDLAGLEHAPGKTFRWGGVYHEDMIGRDTLFTELNVFERFQPKLPDAYRGAELVFLGNIHPSLQLDVLEQVESPRFVAADTMNFWIEGAREELLKVLGRVNALLLNDEEAHQLTGIRAVRPAAAAIQAMGPEVVVIKRGEHGALLFDGSAGADDDGGVFYAPAYPLPKTVDPTGAGDTFGGGFMAYLARTRDLSGEGMRKAAITGCLMASFCVQGFGVERLAGITRDEIRARYAAFRDLTRFGDFEI